ncbi:MAG: transposase [Psychromonas sp.]|nr:transposase [Psychromonas sp.]
MSAEELAHAARTHWSIDIKSHWKLDTAFNEDFSRIKRENSAENIAMVRYTAVNFSIMKKY